ncbi:MAG: diguanylate cyclase [Acidobacteriia bacterium]|nr:diguanylate cyclase [Terriglobia bacterium]
MISIKKFLQIDSETEQTLLHIVQLLLQGIGLHTVEGDPAEYRQFRDSIQQISDSVDESLPVAKMLGKAGAALQAMEEYNRRTTQYLFRQSAELQTMVRMLTSTVGSMSAASNENVHRLQKIDAQVSSATEIDDVRMVKVKLYECLDQIRLESERQRIEARQTIERLNVSLERTQQAAVSGGRDFGLVSGLAGRPAAEGWITDACRSEAPSYAVVMVLDRMPSINLRFGRAVGDQVLAAFAEFLKRQVMPEDRLCRWTGVTFLGLLARAGGIDRVRGEVGRIMGNRLEHKVRTESRSFRIPITARWALFPMMASPRLVIHKIDSFSAFQTSRG